MSGDTNKCLFLRTRDIFVWRTASYTYTYTGVVSFNDYKRENEDLFDSDSTWKTEKCGDLIILNETTQGVRKLSASQYRRFRAGNCIQINQHSQQHFKYKINLI